MVQSNTKVLLESAYVLHPRPYQDSSLLLDIFSQQHGRVGLVAKGVKGKNKSRQALLQAFVPLQLSWSGRGELGTVTDVEANGTAYQFKGQVLLSGFYLNELLLNLLHRHDPHPELFDYYRYTLQQLSLVSGSRGLQQILRVFEMRLLQEIGYGLVLNYEVEQGDTIIPDANYRYLLGQGPLQIQAEKHDSMTFKGSSLLAFASQKLDEGVTLRDAKRLTRQVLDYYLAGKKLHSRQLLLDLQRNAEAAELNKQQP